MKTEFANHINVSTLAILEKKRRRRKGDVSHWNASTLKAEPGLEDVALIDPVMPIFNGLLGLLIHVTSL